MCEICKQQARDMTKSINFNLDSSQIQAYSDLRCRMPTGNEKKEDILPSRFCDQELFSLFLPDQVGREYRMAHQNIFPGGNYSNPEILQLIKQRQLTT